MSSLAVALLLSLAACQPPAENATNGDREPIQDEQLVLRNATLEQADEGGEVLWKINAQRTRYSEDKQTAELTDLTGNLFQDGQLILKVRADSGEIRLEDDGEKVLLRDQIEATDPRNGLTLRAQELDWLPREDRLVARRNLRASHPQLEIAASEARYQTRQEQLELLGEAHATAREQPLQLRSDKLTWSIGDRLIATDRGVELTRYQATETIVAANLIARGARASLAVGADRLLLLAPPPLPETVTDRVVAQQAELNIETLVVLLEDAVESRSLEPPVQIASDSIVWDLKQRTVLADRPVKIVHRQNQVELTANQGFADLEAETVQVTGGALGRNLENNSELSAAEILWQITERRVQAEGSVVYKQLEPPLHLSGSRAVGNLDQQNITITGGSERVVTNIVP